MKLPRSGHDQLRDFLSRESQVDGLGEEAVETLEQPSLPRFRGQLILGLGDEDAARMNTVKDILDYVEKN